MNTLILTDNPRGLSLALELQRKYRDIDIYQSSLGTLENVPCLDIIGNIHFIVNNYILVISIHCKQVFPAELVSNVRCVNVHPGYNPHNRGWYPHIFSIINGKKAGVTIHEMDVQIDHGPIIVQREYIIKDWETSESVYENLVQLEKDLLLEWFVKIRDGAYTPYLPGEEGNLNYKKDYEFLRQVDLERVGKFGDFLNMLRALSHGSYKNAYFTDQSGRRVYVRVILEKDDY